MSHDEKIAWLRSWCDRNGCSLQLEGEVGFLRECVGVLRRGQYPDHDYVNDGEDPFRPHDAYHKHNCVAVLGRGEDAESQLFDWIKWFDDNNYVVEDVPCAKDNVSFVFFGADKTPKMVKRPAGVA